MRFAPLPPTPPPARYYLQNRVNPVNKVEKKSVQRRKGQIIDILA